MPNKQLFEISLFVTAALITIAFVQSTVAQESATPDQPRIRDGWTALPDWAKSGLPFDANVYYDIPDSENRESFYLKAFLELSFRDGSDFFPGIEQQPDYQTKRDAERAHLNRVYELEKHLYETDQIVITPENREEAESIVEFFESGFASLESAQQRNRCFFHCQIDPMSIAPHVQIARDASRLLGIRCALDLENGRAARNARIGFQLKRDLQPLAEGTGQMALAAAEAICFERIIRPILESKTLSDAELDELIAVLVEHYTALKVLDPVIEASRFEYLMLRNLLLMLQSGEYSAQAERRSKDLGLDITLPMPALLVKELTGMIGTYQANESIVDEELAKLREDNPDLATAPEQLKKLREELKKEKEDDPTRGFRGNRANEMVLSLLLLNALNSISDDELAIEISVLDERYRQMAAACALPYPDSTAQIKSLYENWTTDERWKKTKILRWFQPTEHYLDRIRARSQLRVNVYLCLAAAIKWQRNHDGKPPASLEMALREIGIDSVPVDVFSGRLLLMTVVVDQVIVYSVGKDGDDDRAERQFEFFGARGKPLDVSDNPDGDVVLQLNYATRKN